MIHRTLGAVLLLSVVCVVSSYAQSSERIELFNGRDLTGWKPYLDPKSTATPEQVWSVRDGTIICQGQPFGYLRTEQDYGNYVLRVEWRWPAGDRPRRNSGVFVHVNGPDNIWPRGAEAQLMSGRAGDFWLVGGYKLSIDPDRKDPKSDRHWFRLPGEYEKPIGDWNQYEITCRDRDIEVKINGKLANSGTDAETTSGAIILQSEGAEIHFRNVTLERL
jgi:hypothetical protein